MRWLATIAVLLLATAGRTQTAPSAPALPEAEPHAIGNTPAPPYTRESTDEDEDDLPDAPSEVQARQQSAVVITKEVFGKTGMANLPCKISHHKMSPEEGKVKLEDPTVEQARKACIDRANPYDRFLDTTVRIPMTPEQKGYLAVHNLIDPFNILTIVATSGFTIGTDSHTAFGPGWKGVGKLTGITFVQDATGEFFGTFLIPSLAHEDPHYHRMTEATIPRRILHAVSRTVIAQHDDGSTMPNYATLLVYPITSEIANLYVPGVQTNSGATVARILTGYATDPIDNLITEFLPDVAKHVHIRIIFVQRILNEVTTGQPGTE